MFDCKDILKRLDNPCFRVMDNGEEVLCISTTLSDLRDARIAIQKLRRERDQMKAAVEFAHSEGFDWPADPFSDGNE